MKRFLKGVAKYIGDSEIVSQNIEYRLGELMHLPPAPHIIYINYSNNGNKFFKSSKDEKEYNEAKKEEEELKKKEEEDKKKGIVLKEPEITTMKGLIKKKEADRKKKR